MDRNAELLALLTAALQAFLPSDASAEDICDAIGCDLCPFHDDPEGCNEAMHRFRDNLLDF